jgi:SAM-dependent methyltransferase
MRLTTHYPYYRSLLFNLPYQLVARAAGRKCFGYATIPPHFKGKTGLEFGGPSSLFGAKNLIPIYEIAKRIDNCNFAERTLWSKKGIKSAFNGRFGRSFVAEASNPSSINAESYDFVLASHVLEHLANPLRALREWKRILKPQGSILLVVPHRSGTFDHRRPITAFAQILQDYETDTKEDDLSHLDEILKLHDLALDPPAGTAEQFRDRCLRNDSIRAMHHHVFNPDLIVQMFDYWAMEVLNVAVERPYHIIVLARKAESAMGGAPASPNWAFLKPNAEWRKHNPFADPVV